MPDDASPVPSPPRLVALVLAAGQAARMGAPKQLLPHRLPLADGTRQTLVEHAVRAAGTGIDGPVYVVLGAHREAVAKVLEGRIGSELGDRLRLVRHGDWAAGMGSSIAAGVAQVMADPPATDPGRGLPGGLLITLADQPLVTAALLQRLLRAFARERNLPHAGAPDRPLAVAAGYGEGPHPRSRGARVGVPAIFAAVALPLLRTLPPARGAGALLNGDTLDVRTVDAAEYVLDVDTPAAYAAYVRGQGPPDSTREHR